jgi:hypothetical protein
MLQLFFLKNLFPKNTVYAEFCGNVLTGLRTMKGNWEINRSWYPCRIGYAFVNREFRVSVSCWHKLSFDLSHERSFIETGVGVTWAEESFGKTGFQNLISTYEPDFLRQ